VIRTPDFDQVGVVYLVRDAVRAVTATCLRFGATEECMRIRSAAQCISLRSCPDSILVSLFRSVSPVHITNGALKACASVSPESE